MGLLGPLTGRLLVRLVIVMTIESAGLVRNKQNADSPFLIEGATSIAKEQSSVTATISLTLLLLPRKAEEPWGHRHGGNALVISSITFISVSQIY